MEKGGEKGVEMWWFGELKEWMSVGGDVDRGRRKLGVERLGGGG